MEDLKTWRCGHCGLVIDLPDYEAEHDLWATVLNRIREHRFAHLVTALQSSSDEDLLGLCEDEPTDQSADACLSMLGNLGNCAPAGPVDSDDVAPVLVGIAQLLRADLPRARRLWYPINEDGSFNR